MKKNNQSNASTADNVSVINGVISIYKKTKGKKNSTQRFTLFHSFDQRNLKNCVYPQRKVIRNIEDFKQVVQYDHVSCLFKGHHRKNDHFLNTDCLVLEIDNDDITQSELWNNPDDWCTIDDFKNAFQHFTFFLATSRNHDKDKQFKDGVVRPARPKFHVYFPLGNAYTDKDYIQKLINKLQAFYTRPDGVEYFDCGASKVSQMFSGSNDPIVECNVGFTILELLNQIPDLPTNIKAPNERHHQHKSWKATSQNNLVDKLRQIGCYWRHNESSINLFTKDENTKGGYYMFHDTMTVRHHNHPPMSLHDFLTNYWPEEYKKFITSIVGECIHDIDTSEAITVNLNRDEFVSNAMDDGRLEIKNGITLIESPCGTGKGSIGDYVIKGNTPLLYVDDIRRLVDQTTERLREKGHHVVHYTEDNPFFAVVADAVTVCTPSLNKPTPHIFAKRHNDKLTVILDEVHLIAASLFSRAEYSHLKTLLENKKVNIVCLTATVTPVSLIFLKRLQQDLGMDFTFYKVKKEVDNLHATVYTYKKKDMLAGFVYNKIKETKGKSIVVSQSRTAIESSIAPFIAEKLPDRKLNIVTSRTDEELETDDSFLTIGSPSITTGISIDQPVAQFIVIFDDYINRKEYIQQTLSRVRNHEGTNTNCEISVLCQDTPIRRFPKTLKEIKEKELQQHDIFLNVLNTYLVKNTNSIFMSYAAKVSPIGVVNKYIYDETEHKFVADQAKNEIEAQLEAEHEMMQQIGAFAYLNYYKANPSLLHGVKIGDFKCLEDELRLTPEVETDLKAVKQKMDNDNIVYISEVASFKTLKEKNDTLKEIEVKKKVSANESKIVETQLLKFNAYEAGVDIAGKVASKIKREVTGNRPLAYLNTLFYLKHNYGLIDDGYKQAAMKANMTSARQLNSLNIIADTLYPILQNYEDVDTLHQQLFDAMLQLESSVINYGLSIKAKMSLYKWVNSFMRYYGFESQRTRTQKNRKLYEISWKQSPIAPKQLLSTVTLHKGFNYFLLSSIFDDAKAILESTQLDYDCIEAFVENEMTKRKQLKIQ
jgi:hypothetical protein